MCQSLFFCEVARFYPVTLLERGSDTDIFLLILRSFQEHISNTTPPDGSAKEITLSHRSFHSYVTLKKLVFHSVKTN